MQPDFIDSKVWPKIESILEKKNLFTRPRWSSEVLVCCLILLTEQQMVQILILISKCSFSAKEVEGDLS